MADESDVIVMLGPTQPLEELDRARAPAGRVERELFEHRGGSFAPTVGQRVGYPSALAITGLQRHRVQSAHSQQIAQIRDESRNHGGAFFAAFHQNIYPATYSVNDSVNFMLYCFLGGLDFVFGPVVGAFLLVISFELLHDLQQYQALIYGVLMISCILWLPNGILSLALRRGQELEDEETGAPAAEVGGERRGSLP